MKHLTARQVELADEMFCQSKNNTQEIALVLNVPEHAVERALHYLWNSIGDCRQRRTE